MEQLYTGRIDSVGRFRLPLEIRKALNIQDKTPLYIYARGNALVIKPQDNYNNAVRALQKLKACLIDDALSDRDTKALLRMTKKEASADPRHLDSEGRVNAPDSLLAKMGIVDGTMVSMEIVNNSIIVRRYEPTEEFALALQNLRDVIHKYVMSDGEEKKFDKLLDKVEQLF